MMSWNIMLEFPHMYRGYEKPSYLERLNKFTANNSAIHTAAHARLGPSGNGHKCKHPHFKGGLK